MHRFSIIQKPTSLFSRMGHRLRLIMLLALIPTLSFAGQKSNPDSTSILTITEYKTKPKLAGEKEIRKVNYLAKGATLNLTLTDGRYFKQVRVDGIKKDHIILSNGKTVPLSSIQEVKVGKSVKRAASKIFGTIVLAIGILATYMVIWAAFGFAWAFFGFLLLWIPGYLWVEALLTKFPKLALKKSHISVNTVSLASLSEKARIKLSRPSRFYCKKVK